MTAARVFIVTHETTHEHARQLIYQITGILYDRKPIKNTNFGIIYGQGSSSLAVRNNVSLDESKEIIDSILAGPHERIVDRVSLTWSLVFIAGLTIAAGSISYLEGDGTSRTDPVSVDLQLVRRAGRVV